MQKNMQFPVKSAPTTLNININITHYKQCSFNHALMMTKDLKIDRQVLQM